MSTVNLSTQTFEILKNFCTINSSILIREGTVLKTISIGENSIAEYNSEELFPQTFGIYDLNQFLGGLSLFGNDATLEFGNSNYVTINGNGRSAKYYFSDPEITLNASPEREIIFPDADFSFNLEYQDLISLQKASAVYGLPDLLYTASADGTSWLGTNAPEVLLYASLCEAYVFMKGEPDILVNQEKRFQEALGRLTLESDGYNRKDAYRDGQRKINA